MKFVLLFIAAFLSFQNVKATDSQPAQAQRWDIQMIQDASMWYPLVHLQTSSQKAAIWPKQKKALQEILQRYPKSSWADDAALMLAGGKASFDHDPEGAITDLKSIIEKYPNAQTIVQGWTAENWAIIDGIWMEAIGGLVTLNSDGSIRQSSPFDKNGPIDPLMKEYLTYADHLAANPNRTKVVARRMMAQISSDRGDNASAIKIMEAIVTDSHLYLAAEADADEKASSAPEGYQLRCFFRVEYSVHLQLAGLYIAQKERGKAASTIAWLADNVGKDGWNWRLSQAMGNFFAEQGLIMDSIPQYRRAIAGLKREMELDKARNKAFGESEEVDENLAGELKSIEKRLAFLTTPATAP